MARVGEDFTDLQYRLEEKPLGPRVRLNVEQGSDLVAPPAYTGKDESELFAVFELPADARTVVDAYAKQAKAFYPADDGSESWEWGDATVIERNRMCRGPCGIYRVRAVISPNGSGYMLVRLMLRPQ